MTNNCVTEALCELENNVTNESITKNDFSFVEREIIRFNVSDEI